MRRGEVHIKAYQWGKVRKWLEATWSVLVQYSKCNNSFEFLELVWCQQHFPVETVSKQQCVSGGISFLSGITNNTNHNTDISFEKNQLFCISLIACVTRLLPSIDAMASLHNSISVISSAFHFILENQNKLPHTEHIILRQRQWVKCSKAPRRLRSLNFHRGLKQLGV